jgi:DNA-binding SARP family transcriptional activator
VIIQSLGPFSLVHDGMSAVPSAPKQRQALAMLTINANRPVSASALVYELWGERSVKSGPATLQAYVARLRRFLAERLGVPLAQVAGTVLTTEAGGYVLHWEPMDLDHRRFESTVALGREALAARQPEQAARLFGTALALWRGRALENVGKGPSLEIQTARLETLRMAAAEQRYELDLQLGRHYEVLADLTELAGNNPFNETVHALLMRALARTGKRFEALQTYEELRERLVDEVGFGPSPQIAALHQRISRTAGGTREADRAFAGAAGSAFDGSEGEATAWPR